MLDLVERGESGGRDAKLSQNPLLGRATSSVKLAATAKGIISDARSEAPAKYVCYSPVQWVAVVNRWDEKAGLRAGCYTLPSYRRARSARDKGDRQ